ncbi:MAG: polysaccharide deacetylase family protein [Chloroflexi bacterium]|nr:polysaccharide deacetylase family protein [Chloroflexota bacterium]
MDARLRHPLADLVTVMWHYVRDPDAEPRVGATAVDPVTFEDQIDLIGRSRTVVGWPAVAAALGGGRGLPSDAVLLTFDDGLVDHHRTVLEHLARRGWPGVFFVTARRTGERLSVGHRIHVLLATLTPDEVRAAVLHRLGRTDRARFLGAERRERAAGVDAIDVLKRPLQRDLAQAAGPILSALIDERWGSEADLADAIHVSATQVADLRGAGMTIGGHGRHHLWLDWEPADRVWAEVADSAAFLADEPKPWSFAYPYGAGHPVAAAALAKAGFSAAFHARTTMATGPFDLGRVDAEAAGVGTMLRGSGR